MQATPGDNDISLSNLSRRIIVVSSTIAQAKSCIYRIQNLNGQSLPRPSEASDETITVLDPSGSSSGLIKIPWTITNKYYSALVHFAAHTMHGLSPHEVQNIPAVIFVWSQGESYKHHVLRIAQDLSGCEPEVCLAVRIPPHTSPSSSQEESEEEDSEIDAFLSSHGFEYIDAAEEQSLRSGDEGLESNTWSEGIPGLSRVLDALSTIMWPSMHPRTKDTSTSTKTRERERSLLDWAHSSQDNSITTVEEVVASSSSQLSERSTSMKKEMQELTCWLEEDGSLRDDPWKSAASSSGTTASPTNMDFGHETPRAEQMPVVTLGFDDDFTVFVSAPSVDPAEISGRLTPDASTGGLSPASAHPSAGDLYRSLGSVSDFGGSDDGRDVDDVGSDDDLPSEDEILAASSRIFGSVKFPTLPDMESRTVIARPPKTHTPAEASSPSKPYPKVLSDSELESFATENLGDDGEGSYNMEAFDLSKVLGALQEMKAEIASMEDEGERRKAAAKVALGLVYGLEAES